MTLQEERQQGFSDFKLLDANYKVRWSNGELEVFRGSVRVANISEDGYKALTFFLNSSTINPNYATTQVELLQVALEMFQQNTVKAKKYRASNYSMLLSACSHLEGCINHLKQYFQFFGLNIPEIKK